MWLLTLKSILVATDLEEASSPALRTAARLASLADARLHLLHVADEHTPDGHARLAEHFQRVVPGAPAPATVREISGPPATVIVEYAADVDADAIILGPHRRAGSRGEMGSTAAAVVRTAACPCLVAAADLRLPLERVIAPVDLSGTDGGVLSVALSWASALRPRGRGAQLTALHVAPGGASGSAELAVREEVRRARSRAGGAAHVDILEGIVPGSDPAAAILSAATSDGADLLVMGTRGAAEPSSGLGSVSDAVARDTPCPLLLVPPITSDERAAES